MIIDIIGYFFAFIFLSKMLAIPFVGYPTLLSSHINITKKCFFTSFFVCITINIYICTNFRRKDDVYCLLVRCGTFGLCI